MAPPTIPPEEIAQLMHFIAEKAKNVKSPMNITELCRQFQKETGSLVTIKGLESRINSYRGRIHELNEFDMVTKVKMIFALSAPINAGFLIEMEKVAQVEVDNQRRIIQYKQKDGGLELSGKCLRISLDQAEQRDREIVHLLAEKSKTTDKPIIVKSLLREFKAKTGCTDTIKALEHRYQRVKRTIYQSSEFDKNTKIKIMFISNMKLPDDVLEELREGADVEVDEQGRITKYKSNDGSLEVQSIRLSQSPAAIKKRRKRARVVYSSSEVSEKDGEESLKVEDDWSMDFDASNADDFDYDPSKYELDMDHLPIEKKPESLMEVKTEESSTSIVGNHYEKNFFKYDLLNNVDEHIPVEKKPENYIEVKLEEPEESSTNNLEYHYEENMDHILIEPKSEFFE